MAFKLKNLEITSTDLVDQGANPEAQIGLFKGLFSGKKSLEGEKSCFKGDFGILGKEGDGMKMAKVSEAQSFAKEAEAEVRKAYESQIAMLEKRLALGELEQVAKKYEVLGMEPKGLSEKLYSMKETGVYEEYVAVLDLSLTLLGKTGLFQEIGQSAVYSTEGVEDLMRREGCTREAAFMKAYEEDPVFASAYEAEYVK